MLPAAESMGGMLTIGVTALGVDNLARATTFWTEALGYVVEDTTDRSASLRPPGGTGIPLYMHLSDTPVQEHPRVHLDLMAPDLPTRTAEIMRLQKLGATVVDWDSYPPDPDFVVLADTEGNRFCVINASHTKSESL
jgi:catechol 2,3-dioxygenase-like lactoylglutathione lyase family enzyme